MYPPLASFDAALLALRRRFRGGETLMKAKTRISLGLFATLAAAFSLAAAPVTLVENGRARAIIVVPDGKTSAAAADLRTYVEKVSGARLEVVEEGTLGQSAS